MAHGLTELSLATHIGRAAQAWPTFSTEGVSFAGFLGERLAPAELETAPLADLYLAHASLGQIPNAIAELSARLTVECDRTAARHRGEVDAVELFLELCSKLLTGEKPRLAEYAGRGSLGGWLAATVIRAALNARREAGRRRTREEGAAPAQAAIPDPELELLRARSRETFNAVFREVVEALDPKERALLKLHVVDGLGLDRIARLRGIGRSTAARWLASIRSKLLAETRGRLAKQLSVGDSTLDALLPLLKSDLDWSLREVLNRGVK